MKALKIQYLVIQDLTIQPTTNKYASAVCQIDDKTYLYFNGSFIEQKTEQLKKPLFWLEKFDFSITEITEAEAVLMPEFDDFFQRFYGSLFENHLLLPIS